MNLSPLKLLITSELDRLEELTKKVGTGNWEIQAFTDRDFAVTWTTTGDTIADTSRRETAEYFIANDPEATLTRIAVEREVLARHRRGTMLPSGNYVCLPHPITVAPHEDECPEVLAIAHRLRLKVDQ